MSEPVLRIEKSEGVATLTLNRPKVMNALSHELRQAIVQTLADLKNDAQVGVVIVTGAGRAFCAGLDLKELSTTTLALNDADPAGTGANIIQALDAYERPIIGAINGVAITGGFELALACDVLIASTEARFADTHARIGVMPGWGLSQKLSRAIGVYRAKELSLTGNFLSAESAAAWGLVNRVVTPAALLPTCRALAKDILSCEPQIVRSLKRVINEGFATTLHDGLRVETEAWRAQVRQVTPKTIAARRADVQQRGRRQVS